MSASDDRLLLAWGLVELASIIEALRAVDDVVAHVSADECEAELELLARRWSLREQLTPELVTGQVVAHARDYLTDHVHEVDDVLAQHMRRGQ
jgi:hypothetical protein